MRQLRWLTLLWPGWPQLWFAGAYSGLAIAIGFAALLDLGLLTSRMWTELLSPAARAGIWLVLGVVWLASAAVSWRWVARLRTGPAEPADDQLFIQAREEYLKGNWFEAETVLGRLLDRNVLDLEARLLRANLLFRTARRREAMGELDRLSRMDGGEAWTMEIARLRAHLADARSSRTAKEAAADDDKTRGGSGAVTTSAIAATKNGPASGSVAAPLAKAA